MSESEKFPAREYSQAKEQWLGIKCMILPTLERELGKRISGKRVLDVGCGSGTYVENFLKWGASHIIGIDSNENIIELCKSKFEGDSKLEFHVHSAIDMPYNEEFDLATSLFALQFMENFNELEKTLTNIQKALKPGGEFLAFVPHGRPDIHFTDEAGKKFGAYLKPASHPPPDGSRVKIIFYDKEEIIGDADATFFYVETYERLLRKAGFSKIEWIEPYIDPKFIAKYGEEFFQCIKDPPRDLLLYAIKG